MNNLAQRGFAFSAALLFGIAAGVSQADGRGRGGGGFHGGRAGHVGHRVVGGRYYGGVWYGTGRRWYNGRWWAYGVGSCWRMTPDGYHVWVCG